MEILNADIPKVLLTRLQLDFSYYALWIRLMLQTSSHLWVSHLVLNGEYDRDSLDGKDGGAKKERQPIRRSEPRQAFRWLQATLPENVVEDDT